VTDSRLPISFPRALLYGLVFLLGATIVVGASSSGATYGLYNTDWNGTAELRSVISEGGKSPRLVQQTTQYRSVEANGSLTFVLSPDRPYTEVDAARL
jgi:hypothetical protein